MRSEVVKIEMCMDHGCGKYANVDGNASGLLAKLLPDMKVGETRNVKVTVEFVETPRERLKRAVAAWEKVYQPHEQSMRDKALIQAIGDYLAATEGEK